MKIQRRRYVITRNNNTEIFCGLARMYHFKKINEVGDTPIKTYSSEKKAKASFESSWIRIDFKYNVLEVVETIEC